MPWDTDLDVQISEAALYFLSEHYNMTEHTMELPGGESRTYLLEINPNFVHRTVADKANVIDARWIDTSSGLFIDITGVRRDYRSRNDGQQFALLCKDRHQFDERDIFPLRDSFFEEVPVKIPYAYTTLLAEEYGADSMVRTHYRGYTFNYKTNNWERGNRR